MYYLWKAVVVVLVLLSNHVVMPRNIATAQTRNAQASSQSTEHTRMLQGPMLPSQRRTVVTRPSAYGINQRGNRITNNRNVPAVATPIPKNTTTKTPTRTAAPIGAADDGIPTNTPTKTAVPAYPWGVFTEISAGYGHSCALTSVGSAYCWGENTLGQLGSGSTISIYFPVPVIVPAGVTTFTEISAGDTHTCMLTSTGAAYCTGSSRYGQLGNGITDISTISNIPVTVSMPTGVTTFASISAGDKHTCALTNAGVAYCWGRNNSGQLGDGSTTDRNMPVAVSMPAGVTFVAISANGSGSVNGSSGDPHTCALTNVGEVYCWGGNTKGQLGDGTTTQRTTPVVVIMPSGITFTSVSAGGAHTCALTNAGTAYCWGYNHVGQLGIGSTTQSTTPVPVVVSGIIFESLIAGGNRTCAWTSTDVAYCWGQKTGDMTDNNRLTPVAVKTPDGVIPFAMLSTGDRHTCALTSSGEAYCWGENQSYQLGTCDSNVRYWPHRVGYSSGSLCVPNWALPRTSTSTPTNPPIATLTPSLTPTRTLTPSRTLTSSRTATSTHTPTNTPVQIPPFVHVETGAFSTCGLTSAGVAYCWGGNTYGQLGNGTTTHSNIPLPVTMPAGVSFTSISVGGSHVCAVTTTGTVYCWGSNGNGWLGNGSTTSSTVPTAITMPVGVTFDSVVAGNNHTCALIASGAVYCWGFNLYGQLGNGVTTLSTVPVAVTMPTYNDGSNQVPVTFTSISTFSDHTCGLVGPVVSPFTPTPLDGTIYCWGKNGNGQLGDGTTSDSNVPVATTMPAGVTFTMIAIGAEHTCALTSVSSGSVVYCWGKNNNGQVGDGTTTGSITPVAVTMPTGVTFAEITAGSNHTCATTGSTTYCWGWNITGQLGTGNTTSSTIPVAVTMPTGVTFTEITAGGMHTCAMRSDGTIYCWGSNDYGQLGTCNVIGYTVPTLVGVCGPVNTSTVTNTSTRTPTNSRTATPTRSNTATSTNTRTRTPTKTETLPTFPWGSFTVISVGAFHTCAIATNGSTYCWGNNFAGQVGDGTIISSDDPTPVDLPTGVTFTSIYTGYAHTCALTASGIAYCWGNNVFGQLGDGSTTDSTTPVAVTMPTGVTFVSITIGIYHTCALTASGEVYCWGINRANQLGDGTTTDSTIPVAVTMPTSITFTMIATSGYSTCGLTSAGTVYCWGSNVYGQLGNGTTVNSSTPDAVTMPTGVTFTTISVGRYHVCALTATGEAYCWGWNATGQLGDGSTDNSLIPDAVIMPTGVTFSALSVGWSHTCALTSTGIAYCWGQNIGQIGDGTTTDRVIPVLVLMPAGIVFSDINAGAGHTCALASNGIAYCWGSNTNGQLGLCNCIAYLSPTRVGVACTPSSTHTATITGTNTATNTRTATFTRTSTNTPTESATPTNSRTATDTRTATNTRTATSTRTETLTPTSSNTPTESATPTNSRTTTYTRTATSTRTAINTRTETYTRTASNTPTDTNTPTNTRSNTATRTVTNTITATSTITSTPTHTATNTPMPLTLKKAAVGNMFILGLLSNGTLVTWGGKNEFGETSIPSIYKNKLFMDVATTVDTAFGLDVDGNLYAWGGTPKFNVKNIPVNAQTNVKAIGSGANFVVVIKNDGSLVAWGEDSFSQVSKRPAGNDYVAVDGGPYHACAIKADTTVKCWGSNSAGQSTVPAGLKDVVAVSAGQDHTVALLSTGKLVGWGSNLKNQITLPANLSGIVSVTAGRMCTIAVKSDGTIWATGDVQYYTFGSPAITNAFSVASDNQNSIVGLRNNGVRVAGLRLTDSGINVSRTPTRTPTP